MLDIKYLLANLEEVKQNCRNRNMPPHVLEEADEAVALDGQRKELLHKVEEIRRRQNEVAKATSKESDPQKRTALVDEGRQLKASAFEGEETLKRLEADIKRRMMRIPNLAHPDAPVGTTDDDNREVRKVMAHLNLQVTRLIRVAYGPFQLGNLDRGTVDEITGKVLREQLSGMAKPAPPSPSGRGPG